MLMPNMHVFRKKLLMPKDVPGNVLSLVAKQANAGQTPTSATNVWSDRSKTSTQYSYSNIINNGNFINLTGWDGNSLAILSANNNIMNIVANGTAAYGGATQINTITNSLNNTFTVKVKATVDNSVCTGIRFILYGTGGTGYEVFTLQASPNINQQYNIAYNLKLTSLTTVTSYSIYHQYVDTVTSNGKGMQVQQLMLINDTTIGLDTLSSVQCDTLFPFTTMTNSNATQIKYNPNDWVQWTKSAVASDSTGLEFTFSGTTGCSGILNTNLSISTKYGLLYNVVSCNLSATHLQLSNNLTGGFNAISSAVGNGKLVITTSGTISTNQFKLVQSALGDAGLKIKLKDLRLFTLPSGSQIETDFTNLTADQLNTLYPMGYNEATTQRANDCLMLNQAGTSVSGFNSEVNGTTGKTTYYNRIDGVDDYGSFINNPSLDITSNEIALACTFRVAVGAGAGFIIAKALDAVTTSQYALIYSSKQLYLRLNGTIHYTGPANSILENVWYNFIIYRNSAGVITPYINKVSGSTSNYTSALTSQPNINMGACTSNSGGTVHNTYLKGDIATQSIYQAPTLDINKIIKSEMNASYDYTGVK